MTSIHCQRIDLALLSGITALVLIGCVHSQVIWQELPETYLADELRENMQCESDPETDKRLFCYYEIPDLRFAVWLDTATFEIDEVGGNYSIQNYAYTADPDGPGVVWTPLNCLRVKTYRVSPHDDMDFQIPTAHVHLETGKVSSSSVGCF